MRFYGFGNMYLSSIQQGIQAAHVIGNMSTKYASGDYSEWAKKHKTIILLNGGSSCNLANIVQHFSDDNNPYHWNYFCESQDALDGALTSVGIILPEQAYNTASMLRSMKKPRDGIFALTEWERALYEIMNSCRMAQ